MRARSRPMPLPTAWRASVDDYVSDLAPSPESKTLAVAGIEGRITLFDIETGEARELPGHGFGTTALSWSPDCRTLASAGQDGKIRLWDTKSGEERRVLDGGAPWVEKVAYAPDGRYLVSAAGRSVRMWRSDGDLLWVSPAHESTVVDVRWRPGTSKSLVSAAYGGLTLWRPEESKQVRRFKWKGSTLVALWSPNGKHIATGDQDSTVHFWNVKSGEDLQMYGYPTKVRELAWSPTSRYLATGGGPAVTVWDCSGKGPAGTKPLVLEAHEDDVSALSYQRVGPLLASGGLDGTVALWRPGTLKTPHALENVGSAVTGISWTPNDRFLAVGGEDGTVAMFRAPSAKP